MSDQRVVWKFDARRPMIELPAGAEIVSFAMQFDRLVLWAVVDPAAPKVTRYFRVVDTGWHMPANLVYRGTAQGPAGMVWHLFEDPA